jgi:hypothetical protein
MPPSSGGIQSSSRQQLSFVWLRAALLGSGWASIEIIVGSFLHNLRVPFTGTTLTAIGVSMLVAGQLLWPDRGLVWRAGVICALMKSISPSAVLIGPMIGILSESLMMQLAVWILGRNVLGFLIGGALAVCMPLTYRIIELLIAFGFNAARVYTGLYNFAAARLGITGFEAYDLLLVLYGIYAVFGLAAAVLGIIVGRQARKLLAQPLPPVDAGEYSMAMFADPNRRYSIILLAFHLLLIPCGMIAIGKLPVYAVALALGVYAFWVARRYPRAWRRLRKPSVWIVIVVMGLGGGLALGYFGASGISDGLVIGIQMVLRALLMIAAFGSISIELRNPAIVAWFFERGMGQVSAALEVAFTALPQMISLLKSSKGWRQQPLLVLARLIAGADVWLRTFQETIGCEEREGARQ